MRSRGRALSAVRATRDCLLDSALDMGPLAAVERFLERLFERQSARLFRTAIRPVQVQRRVERVMESDRVRDGARTIVPHRYVVRLQADDLASLGSAAPDLAASLADSALAFARSHGYTLRDRPVVMLRPDERVAAGDIVVDALDPDAPAPRSSAPAQRAEVDIDADDDAADLAPPPRSSAMAGDEPPSIDQTAVFVVPGIDGPRATIREIRPDRSSRTIEFDGRPLTIGRASDNDLTLNDASVSKIHAALLMSGEGTLLVADTGSTNGTYLNGRRISYGESRLIEDGDVVGFGDVEVRLRKSE